MTRRGPAHVRRAGDHNRLRRSGPRAARVHRSRSPFPRQSSIQADISNDNAQPIAVAITPVLKLGTKTPTKLPSQWTRKKPVAAKSEPAAPSLAAGREDAGSHPEDERARRVGRAHGDGRRGARAAEHHDGGRSRRGDHGVVDAGLRAGRCEWNGDGPAQGARRRHVPGTARVVVRWHISKSAARFRSTS